MLGEFDFVLFDKAITDLAVLGQRKRVGHCPADDDVIANVEQVVDHFDFVGDFCTTQNRNEGSVWIADDATEVLDLFLDQVANNFRLVSHRAGYADHRSVFTVAGSKRVIAIDVSETS